MDIWDGGGLGLPPTFTQADVAAALGTRGLMPVPGMAKRKLKFAKPRYSGSIAPTPNTVGSRIEGGIASLLGNVTDERNAARLGSRFMSFFNDATPVGNVTGAEAGKEQFHQGLTKGDLGQMALGAGTFGLSVAPLPGGVKRGVKHVGKGMFGSMLKDKGAAIRAWHGSPHDFEKFEWSPRTRGTGEGAQAYGDGLYFAENRDVARIYRSQLAGLPTHSLGGPPQPLPGLIEDFRAALEAKLGGPIPAALKGIENDAAVTLQRHGPEGAAQRLMEAYADVTDPAQRKAIEEAAALTRVAQERAPGRLYEVNINAEPEDFLDWDRPLAQQPKAMQALGSIDLSHLPQGNRTRVLLERAGTVAEQAHYPATGRELLNAVSGYGEQRAGDLMALQPYGIKGVQFLDQGSRGAGQGTRNFVVPDHSLLEILGKY